MISFVKKFNGMGVSEIWFASRLSFFNSFRLVKYMHLQQPVGNMFKVKQHSYTIENSLYKTEGEIFESLSKTVKVEVKQAQRHNIKCDIITDLEQFVAFYNKYAIERHIPATSVQRLKEMAPNLILTIATHNRVVLAAHSYLVDSEQGIVRLMHSASGRFLPLIDKQLSGRANKLLHYSDMLHFKKLGFGTYDFGGYAKDTNDLGLLGINWFKLSFGGKIVPCKNFSSIPYFIVKKLMDTFMLRKRALAFCCSFHISEEFSTTLLAYL
jgi:hypothetical protein